MGAGGAARRACSARGDRAIWTTRSPRPSSASRSRASGSASSASRRWRGCSRPLLAALGLGAAAAVHSRRDRARRSRSITFLHVVVGELAPKALALDRPGPVALACAQPLLMFGRVFRPVLRVMNGAGNALVRAARREARRRSRAPCTRPRSSRCWCRSRARPARSGRTPAAFSATSSGIARTRVRDVMVPRERVLAVERRVAARRAARAAARDRLHAPAGLRRRASTASSASCTRRISSTSGAESAS